MGNFHGHVDTFMISGAGETPQMEGSRNASKWDSLGFFYIRNLILNRVTGGT